MIDQSLKQLGFGEKEIIVYLTILKQGKILPANVAKLTNLNRSTVYSVASELKKRGVISEDLGGPVRYLVALPPEDLMQLATREEQALQKKKGLIQEAVNELQTFVSKAVYQPPKIVFISQDEIPAYLRKHSGVWSESIMKQDGIWWGFQDHTLVDHYQDWIEWYWTQAPSTLHTRLLTNRSETEKRMAKKKIERRGIHFWKEANQFTATVWICGDYLVMVTTNQTPHSLVEIHDTTLAHNMREVFKGIWKTLPS